MSDTKLIESLAGQAGNLQPIASSLGLDGVYRKGAEDALKAQRLSFPNIDAMRFCMIETADENARIPNLERQLHEARAELAKTQASERSLSMFLVRLQMKFAESDYERCGQILEAAMERISQPPAPLPETAKENNNE
jgi:hypothetical protein